MQLWRIPTLVLEGDQENLIADGAAGGPMAGHYIQDRRYVQARRYIQGGHDTPPL